MNKILVVCPKYGPSNNALSAYTTLFCEEIAKIKKINVLTNYEELPKFNEEHLEVHPVVKKWSFFGLLNIIDRIDQINPDAILFEYVPYLYGRAGINFGLVFFVMYLRLFRPYKIQIMLHELYYPFQLKIKLLIIHYSHLFMLFVLILSSKDIFVSTNYFKFFLSIFFFFKKKRIFHLPVGANIKPSTHSLKDINNFKNNHKIRESELILGSFGNFHPAKKYQMVFQALEELKLPIKFIFIGQTIEDVYKNISEDLHGFIDNHVIATGKLNDYEVNLALSAMDIYIGYFIDGLSTRRGSVIAALQIGVPVISTMTWKTDDLFYFDKEIYLLKADDDEFKKSLNQLIIKEHQHLKPKEKTMSKTFIKHFTWASIVRKYVNFSQ